MRESLALWLMLGSVAAAQTAAARTPGLLDTRELSRAIVLVAAHPSRVMLMYERGRLPAEEAMPGLVTEAACRAHTNVNARYPGLFPLPVTVHVVELVRQGPGGLRPSTPPVLEHVVPSCDGWQPTPDGQGA